jgi:hypothetical protein
LIEYFQVAGGFEQRDVVAGKLAERALAVELAGAERECIASLGGVASPAIGVAGDAPSLLPDEAVFLNGDVEILTRGIGEGGLGVVFVPAVGDAVSAAFCFDEDASFDAILRMRPLSMSARSTSPLLGS